MSTTLKGQKKATAARPPGLDLPARMRVLYISTTARTGGWLAEALAIDSASKVVVKEAMGSTAGLARLRDDVFDAVLVSHQPCELDALELIEAYRTGVADAPIVVLGSESEQEMAALCYELGADAYVCVNTTTTRNLLWVLARAMERHALVRESHRLAQTQQRRSQQEQDEAAHLLCQQRSLVADLETLQHGADSPTPVTLPAELVSHYRELLRAHVIMGSGNLSGEMSRLAELLSNAGVTAREAMALHLRALEELVQGLGARSARHVMTRADLLALEMMMRLAESYQARYRQRVTPEVQSWLPGFDSRAPVSFW
jgi:DNA-binding response OmpR family regulator